MNSSKHKTSTDSELISLCLKGDAFAWEALIRRYRRLIYSVPLRFGLGEADASDVFQNVCVKLLEHLHEVKDDTKIGWWLMTTASRQCLHVKARRSREAPEDGATGEREDPGPNLEELRIEGEQQQAIREAVDELTGRCRPLIAMLYFDVRSPSYEDISREIGLPVASIGPTRARCLEKLRLILRRKGIQ